MTVTEAVYGTVQVVHVVIDSQQYIELLKVLFFLAGVILGVAFGFAVIKGIRGGI